MSSFPYTPPSRESIYAALFALVSAAQIGAGPAFKTMGRRIPSDSQIASQEKPALYQVQADEIIKRGLGSGMPYVDRMHVVLYLMVAQPDNDQPVSPLLNAVVDAVVASLQPATTSELQTLGGLVYDVRIGEKIEYFDSLAGVVNAIAVIPIEILTGGLQPD
jgi:hypothetical protein